MIPYKTNTDMFLWELRTEDRPNLANLARAHSYDGFTLIRGVGGWKGEIEYGAIIQIIAPLSHGERVMMLALDIRQENDQQEVLVTRSPITEVIHV